MSDMVASKRGGIPWRVIGWGGAVCLLLTPLVAMQFTSEVDWSPSDFIVMGVLFGITGLGIEVAARQSRQPWYRAGAAVAALTGFGLVWVNLAVGILGSEENDANGLFALLLVFALGATFAVRARAPAMAKVMLATAVGQVLVSLGALAAGLASPGSEGIYEVMLSCGLFGGLWLASAALFAKAAQQEGRIQR